MIDPIRTLSFKSPVYVNELDNGLILCFVDMAAFIDKYLTCVDPEKYMFQKNIEIDYSGPLAEVYSVSEIEGVNCFKTLKKQVEWMCGRLAVKHLLVSEEIMSLKMSGIEIGYEPHGAPFLVQNPAIPVSISHSGNLAVCCSSHGSRTPPGLDLERMEVRDMKYILDVAFSSEEQKSARGAKNLEIYRLWTLKEAFLKYIREGFNENLKVCEIIGDKIVHRGTVLDELKVTSWVVNENYMLSLVE